MAKSNRPKIMYVAGAGGHLTEILKLSPMFKKYSYALVTEKCDMTKYLEKKFPNKVYYLVRNSSFRHPLRLLVTCFKSLFLYFKLKPKFIITTGPNIVLGNYLEVKLSILSLLRILILKVKQEI